MAEVKKRRDAVAVTISCFNNLVIGVILKESSFILNADLQNRYKHLLVPYV